MELFLFICICIISASLIIYILGVIKNDYKNNKTLYNINNNNIHKNGSKYIPKNIYQLVQDKNKIHPRFMKNINYIKKINPTWSHTLYDDNDMIEYIKNKYNINILNIYNLINPKYGASKADFFRYLLMYREGGVYLDIKSSTKLPLDVLIQNDDEYLLSYWGCEHYSELIGNKYGELQQWHIICKPNHPYLKEVINNVINNIINYNIKTDGFGKIGVLKVTGPIVYTKSILPILSKYNHTLYETNDSCGLIYNNLDNNFKDFFNIFSHRFLYNKTHYSKLKDPIIINNKQC